MTIPYLLHTLLLHTGLQKSHPGALTDFPMVSWFEGSLDFRIFPAVSGAKP